MRRHLTRIAVQVGVVVLAVSFLTFLIADFLPGDPAVSILGPRRPPADYEQLRQDLGLNDAFLVRYWHWLSDAGHGDFGRSLVPPRGEVSSSVAAALPVSLELCVLAFLFSLLLAVPLALWSAHRPQGVVDRTVSGGSFALLSMPEFVIGLLLILVLVVMHPTFPRLGWSPLTSSEGVGENLRHAFLPTLALALPQAALFTQVLRNDLVRTLQEDFILAARATGESPARVLVQGALRPSLFSLITLAGVCVGYLIGGTVVVETLFGLPGLGRLLVTAAEASDVPMVLAVTVVLAGMCVVANALIDLSYGYLDPRIRRAPRL